MTTKSKKIAKAAMISIVGASLAGGMIASAAASPMVKCYGIAQKGKNDCGTKAHACAGQAVKSNLPNEWVYAKKKDCVKKGGNVSKPKS